MAERELGGVFQTFANRQFLRADAARVAKQVSSGKVDVNEIKALQGRDLMRMVAALARDKAALGKLAKIAGQVPGLDKALKNLSGPGVHPGL